MAFPLIAAIALAAAQAAGKAKQQRNATEENSATMRYSPWTKLAGQAASAEAANQANGVNLGESAANVFGSYMGQNAADEKYADEKQFRSDLLGTFGGKGGGSDAPAPMSVPSVAENFSVPQVGQASGFAGKQKPNWVQLAANKKGY